VNQVEITRDLYYTRVANRAWLGRGRDVRTGGGFCWSYDLS
jgi:hypothetical protein